MSWPERVVIDPEILAGKPVVRGTRWRWSSFWNCSPPANRKPASCQLSGADAR